MSRLRDALLRPVIFVVAILTIQTIDVVSWPAKARQAPAEGKSEAANPEKLLADGDCRSCAKLPISAAEIDALARGMPLYATDVSAAGLSVASSLDARRFPRQPLQWPPREWPSGFVLSHTENPELGKVFRKFRLGRSDVYLLCRGVACDERSRIVVPSS